MKSLAKKVTVVICVRNGEETIRQCIESVINNHPAEIIIVDGNSTDNTVVICKEYKLKVLRDKGIGLGNARNVGLKDVSSEYVYYVGPDNILEKGSIGSLVAYIEDKNWIGSTPLIIIHSDNSSYVGRSLNIYRKAKMYEGEREIIGTPWMYKTNILKKFYFDDLMNYSDDKELCSRIAKSEYKFGISNVKSYELGEDNFSDLAARWTNYGNSDSEFYRRFKNEWNTYRKFLSFLSPIRKDFIVIIMSKKINLSEKLFILPFLFFILYIRYLGWISAKKRF